MMHNYISSYGDTFSEDLTPWEITSNLTAFILKKIEHLKLCEFEISNNIAIHKTSVIEKNVVIKAPAIIGNNCFIGSNSYLRNGVYLFDNVTVGTGIEMKTAVIFENTSIAHFNFIGDSIIAKNVNFEAGSIVANL